MTSDSPQLDYALEPWHRRRLARRAKFWGPVVAGLLVLAAIAPAAWRRAQLFYWQRQCLNHEPPANHVVFECRPDEAKALTVSGTGYASVQQAAYEVAEPWSRFYSASGRAFRSAGTVFLHERRTPSGERRLVAVDLVLQGSPYDFVGTTAQMLVASRVFSVGSLLRPPAEVAPQGLVYMPLLIATTVYAGRPDPNDPTHFTIEYERDGTRHVLDGWLRDDNRVVIESRD